MKVLFIYQNDIKITRRLMQEAHSLREAGHDAHLLLRSADTEDHRGEVEGVPAEWIAVKGRDPRFKWLYKLAGVARGSQVAALWSVLTMRHTFTMRAVPRAIASKADVYHAVDLNNLLVGYRAAKAKGAKLVYEAYELFPDVDNRWVRLKRGAWMRRERQLAPHADLSITVNEFIAEEIARRNNMPAPLVVLNCPDPPAGFDPLKRYDLIRERLNIAPAQKIVLYHGWIAKGRGLEDLVRATPMLAGKAVVVLIGYSDEGEGYRRQMEELGEVVAPGRVFTLPALPYRDLFLYCASADVGMVPIRDLGLNYRYTAPNRLFDFIQAGVPIVANDLPFLRKVIASDNLGVVSQLDSPGSYADAINRVLTLPDGGAEIRANMRRVAPLYTWKAQAQVLLNGYERLAQGH